MLQVAFGARPGLAGFLAQIGDPLSIAIPLGAVWVYYGRNLSAELNAMPDDPRRAGLRRLYFYLLALLGLGATFIGLQLILSFVLDLALSPSILGGPALRDQLAISVSTLAVGLPLWIIAWRPMVHEAAQEGESGDHARRSVVRKSYLFLTLFIGVMGVMFGAGVLLYQVIRAMLGQAPANLVLIVAQQIKVTLLFGLLAAYHWQALRADGRIAERSLAKRHAQFPVLVFAPGEIPEAEVPTPLANEFGIDGDFATPPDFATQIVNALQRQAPALPVAIHPISQGAPDENSLDRAGCDPACRANCEATGGHPPVAAKLPRAAPGSPNPCQRLAPGSGWQPVAVSPGPPDRSNCATARRRRDAFPTTREFTIAGVGICPGRVIPPGVGPGAGGVWRFADFTLDLYRNRSAM